jgi:hypothetical protein
MMGIKHFEILLVRENAQAVTGLLPERNLPISNPTPSFSDVALGVNSFTTEIGNAEIQIGQRSPYTRAESENRPWRGWSDQCIP